MHARQAAQPTHGRLLTALSPSACCAVPQQQQAPPPHLGEVGGQAVNLAVAQAARAVHRACARGRAAGGEGCLWHAGAAPQRTRRRRGMAPGAGQTPASPFQPLPKSWLGRARAPAVGRARKGRGKRLATAHLTFSCTCSARSSSSSWNGSKSYCGGGGTGAVAEGRHAVGAGRRAAGVWLGGLPAGSRWAGRQARPGAGRQRRRHRWRRRARTWQGGPQ